MSEQQIGRRAGGRAAFGMLCGVNIAGLALLGFVLLVLLPKMAMVYADFGTQLPAVTGILLKVSQARAAVLMGLGLFIAAQVAMAKSARRGGYAVLVAGTLIEIVLVVVVACAVFLPYIELINAVAGSNASGG